MKKAKIKKPPVKGAKKTKGKKSSRHGAAAESLDDLVEARARQVATDEKLRMDEAAINSWLMGPARSLNIREILEGFGRLCAIRGLPFHRLGLFIFSIHPQLHGSRYNWSIKTLRAEEVDMPYNIDNINNPPKQYAESPIFRLFSGLNAFIYRPLRDPDCPMDFPVLKELRDEGATDYLAFSLHQSGDLGSNIGYSEGTKSSIVLTLASYDDNGFGEDSLRLLQRLLPPLSMVLELVSARNMTRVILDTYVGKRSGKLVMDGRIHKGDGELIPAVIWFCDMRKFTQLANREGHVQLVNSLNDFFGCMVDSVDDAGGEVLKFMGDALLAIFPLPKERRHFASAVCETALAAAEEAKDKLAQLNKKRKKRGRMLLEFGVSLHVGEVNYGNIGGGSRLDFTVLGKAVNLASRLQGLNVELGRVILVSEDFRNLSKREFELMGEFGLKGIRGMQKVYALKR